MEADAAANVFENLELCGEPLIPELVADFEAGLDTPIPLLDLCYE
jgi:hypothetical protein